MTDARRSFSSRSTRTPRAATAFKDSAHVLLHHDWAAFRAEEAARCRSTPRSRTGRQDAARAVTTGPRTDVLLRRAAPASPASGSRPSPARPTAGTFRGSTARFNSPGVMMLDSAVDSEAEAERVVRTGRGAFRQQPRTSDVRTQRGQRERPFALHRSLRRTTATGKALRSGVSDIVGGAFVVPLAQRTGLRLRVQRGAHPPRIRWRSTPSSSANG